MISFTSESQTIRLGVSTQRFNCSRIAPAPVEISRLRNVSNPRVVKKVGCCISKIRFHIRINRVVVRKWFFRYLTPIRMINGSSKPGHFSRTIAKGPDTTTWIWNLHANAHDFDSHTSDLAANMSRGNKNVLFWGISRFEF